LVIIKAVYFNYWVVKLKMYVKNNFVGAHFNCLGPKKCLIRHSAK